MARDPVILGSWPYGRRRAGGPGAVPSAVGRRAHSLISTCAWLSEPTAFAVGFFVS